jgi:DNA polymerase-3 subunit alpha
VLAMARKQNKASFVHLHVHSAFLSQVFYKDNYFKELIREAVEGGMDTLALTDHGTLLGAYFFREAARAKRIKPVHGLEIDIYPKDVTNNLSTNYLPPYHHVLLLAINATGFQNLVQLTDRYCWPESSPYPYINREMLSQFSEGLICTSACIYGEIPSALLRGDYDDALCIAGEYKDIFGTERFFIEVKNCKRRFKSVAHGGVKT